jgi:hypothetical protein
LPRLPTDIEVGEPGFFQEGIVLVIEDGTGLSNSNAYADIPFVENYLLGGQRQAFTALAESEKEAAIITTTRYIDSVYPWKGTRKNIDQALSWPRIGVELDGFPVERVPAAVRRAAAEGVGLILDNPGGLFSTDNDRIAVSEKVDTLAITYATAKDGGKAAVTRFQVLDSLLRGLIRIDAAATGGSSVGIARVERV